MQLISVCVAGVSRCPVVLVSVILRHGASLSLAKSCRAKQLARSISRAYKALEMRKRFKAVVLQPLLPLLLLIGVTWSSPVASAAPFTVSITGTGTNVHLKATTVPAGRLVWLKGDRLDAITNVVQIEVGPLLQHDLMLTSGVSAAFYRAANLSTNLISAPLAIGASHSLAILTNGQIACWGGNKLGQFGNDAPQRTVPTGVSAACWVYTADINTSTGPLPQSSDTDWISVAAGDKHCLAVKANGTLWAWGDGTYGQLGDSNYFGGGWISFALQIGTNRLWRSVFASQYSSFAIAEDGTLWAWGLNKSTADAKGSVLGLGDAYTNTTSVLIPCQVGTGSNWVKVIAWPLKFGAGIQSDGTLWAWGSTDLPSFIRAGYADTNTLIYNYVNGIIATSPAATGIPGPWVDLSLGVYRQGIVALRADGTLWASKLPGDNSPANWAYLLPWVQTQSADPNSLYNILINSGMSPTDALRYLLVTYYSWSPAMAAALDYDAMLQANSDANILESYSTRGGWVMVDTGISLNQDGTIWTSGDNSSAARSPGSPRDGDWQRVNADTDWRCVRSGFAGVKTDGHIWTWGAGGSSAYLLGNGCVGSATDLTNIPGTNRWLSAKQDGTHVVALDIQSNLWVWGGNTSGELGLGDNEPRLTPTQLPLAGPWLDFALVTRGTLAVRQNGEFWVWGDYNFTGTNLTTPLRLSPERSWRSVYGSLNQGYALAQDGTLWAFGRNYMIGNLGLGLAANTTIAVPQQLAGSNWCFVSPASIISHTLAVQTDGTLCRGVRDAGRAGRHVGLPALAPGLVQVMLHGDGFRLGDLFLLVGPGDAKIGGAVEVRPALAGALGEPVAGHIRLGPGHRRPRRPRLLAPLALLRRVPLRRAPLLPGRPAAGHVIAAGRHRGVAAVTGNGPLQAGYPVLQVRDLGIPRRELLPELRDLLVAGSARGATQGRRQHLGHGR